VLFLEPDVEVLEVKLARCVLDVTLVGVVVVRFKLFVAE
jgi:hypothetical protein